MSGDTLLENFVRATIIYSILPPIRLPYCYVTHLRVRQHRCSSLGLLSLFIKKRMPEHSMRQLGQRPR